MGEEGEEEDRAGRQDGRDTVNRQQLEHMTPVETYDDKQR